MIEQNDCQEDCGCKQNYSSGDFKQQGTSAYNGTTMYFQCTVNKTGKYLASHCSISVVSPTSKNKSSYGLLQLAENVVPGMGSN